MKRLNSTKSRKYGGASRPGARRRGAVLVEAAMVTVLIVLPILLGILQFGLYYYATNTVTQSAREGARWAAVYAMRDDLKAPIPDKYTKDHIIQTARNGGVTLNYNDITISPPEGSSDRSQYKPVTVTVTYDLTAKRILKIYSPGIISRVSQSMIE